MSENNLILSKVESLETRFESLETKLDRMELSIQAQIREIHADVRLQSQRLDLQSERMDQQSRRMDEQAERMAREHESYIELSKYLVESVRKQDEKIAELWGNFHRFEKKIDEGLKSLEILILLIPRASTASV